MLFVGAIFALGTCGDAPRPQLLADSSDTSADARTHEVSLARPPRSGKLRAGDTGIGCTTCHAAGEAPAFATRKASDSAGAFHANIQVVHGSLQCASCHDAKQPESLHDAEGKAIPLDQSMTLCSQCHGLIRRAYDHGAHGGMRGYWDLSRGPRTRNDCITCHAPHRPAYPQVTPMAGPKDRFPSAVGAPVPVLKRRLKEMRHE